MECLLAVSLKRSDNPVCARHLGSLCRGCVTSSRLLPNEELGRGREVQPYTRSEGPGAARRKLVLHTRMHVPLSVNRRAVGINCYVFPILRKFSKVELIRKGRRCAFRLLDQSKVTGQTYDRWRWNTRESTGNKTRQANATQEVSESYAQRPRGPDIPRYFGVATLKLGASECC
jgi:hypothetical protein